MPAITGAALRAYYENLGPRGRLIEMTAVLRDAERQVRGVLENVDLLPEDVDLPTAWLETATAELGGFTNAIEEAGEPRMRFDVTEVVVYEVEADNEESAIETIAECGDRDSYFVACLDRTAVPTPARRIA